MTVKKEIVLKAKNEKSLKDFGTDSDTRELLIMVSVDCKHIGQITKPLKYFKEYFNKKDVDSWTGSEIRSIIERRVKLNDKRH